jgi:predicted translin family RNA/ssDNA-binding protein
MVQADVPQLSMECSKWREQLHSFRDEFKLIQRELQQAVNHPLSKDQQEHLEHFQNQLHIQLINIHDLKQAVKNHESALQPVTTQTQEQMYSLHQSLQSDYLQLTNDLGALRQDLYVFVAGVKN